MTAENRRICLGVIVGAHGIKGDVRIKSFTAEPEDVSAYGLLSDQPGTRNFRVTVRSVTKGAVVAKVEGVADRNAAEALKGTALYVDRDRLPEPEDEDIFYHADLIGLVAEAPDGSPLGRVDAVFDHGAGDVLDIRGADGRVVSVPFTKAVVPLVEVTAGRIVVAMPEGLAGGAAGEDE